VRCRVSYDRGSVRRIDETKTRRTWEVNDQLSRTILILEGPSTRMQIQIQSRKAPDSENRNRTKYNYDSDGNTTSDGVHSYHYNQADRLDSVDNGSTATYAYDGAIQREKKVYSGTTTLYFYAPDGRLLTELVPGGTNGDSGIDYIYADNAPVARLDWSAGAEQNVGDVLRAYKSSGNVHLDWTNYASSSNYFVVRRKQVVDTNYKSFSGSIVIASPAGSTKTYDDPVVGNGNHYDYSVFKQSRSDVLSYYHTDHLGTPILMTDGSPAPIWRAEHYPFGGLFSNTTATATNNLRFPGQYFDSDTGLHQNWFRDYNPKTGRYLEADPIGLAGGLNIYAYVRNDPLIAVDPTGNRMLFPVNPNTPLPVPEFVSELRFALQALELDTLLPTGSRVAAGFIDGVLKGAFPPTLKDAVMYFDAAMVTPLGLLESGAEGVACGARSAAIELTGPGERFVRVAAKPSELNFSFRAPTGVTPGTYAFPEETFLSIGRDPARLADLGDLPKLPEFFRIIEPPVGTPIQRGFVPGGQFGGIGGVPEVYFPEGF
jgi:RHS repeat-associated protein